MLNCRFGNRICVWVKLFYKHALLNSSASSTFLNWSLDVSRHQVPWVTRQVRQPGESEDERPKVTIGTFRSIEARLQSFQATASFLMPFSTTPKYQPPCRALDPTHHLRQHQRSIAAASFGDYRASRSPWRNGVLAASRSCPRRSRPGESVVPPHGLECRPFGP